MFVQLDLLSQRVPRKTISDRLFPSRAKLQFVTEFRESHTPTSELSRGQPVVPKVSQIPMVRLHLDDVAFKDRFEVFQGLDHGQHLQTLRLVLLDFLRNASRKVLDDSFFEFPRLRIRDHLEKVSPDSSLAGIHSKVERKVVVRMIDAAGLRDRDDEGIPGILPIRGPFQLCFFLQHLVQGSCHLREVLDVPPIVRGQSQEGSKLS
mmetsp:Transcript_19125/g.61517  ORF Transcript_19125/g.61517 Transcript_19125/m.61517 type:complete len:206 (-) Transcript_19125:1008-1625(-)